MQERSEPSPVASSRRGWTSLLSLGLAALTCSCHLLLVIVLFAGATLGAWTSQHRVVLTLVMLGVFVVSLLYGLVWSQPSGHRRVTLHITGMS